MSPELSSSHHDAFQFTEEDRVARAEFTAVIEIMKQQRVIGKTTTRHYREAIAERERQLDEHTETQQERPEAGNIEDLADMVLFDWDGVLRDSMGRVAAGATALIRKLGDTGIPHHTDEEIRHGQEAPYYEMYSGFGIPAETEEQRALLFRLYHDEIMPALKERFGEDDPLFPEVATALRLLTERGRMKNPNFSIGIVSAGNPKGIDEKLIQSGIRDTITILAGGRHSKTDTIKEICESQGIDPKRVLYVGDLPSDIRDTRSTGLPIRTIAMARFPEAEERLGSYGPDYMVTALDESFFTLTPYTPPTKK